MAFKTKQDEINAGRILAFYNQTTIQKSESSEPIQIATFSTGKPFYNSEHESYSDLTKSEIQEAIDFCMEKKLPQEDYFIQRMSEIEKSEKGDSLQKAFDSLLIKSEVTEESNQENQ